MTHFIIGELILEGFVDKDLVGNIDNKKSTTRYVYTLEGTTMGIST